VKVDKVWYAFFNWQGKVFRLDLDDSDEPTWTTIERLYGEEVFDVLPEDEFIDV